MSDLIQGLRSDDHKRFTIALSHAETLIRGQNSNDLDLQCEDLLETLFRIQNQFDMDDFMEQKYRAVQALLECIPRQAIASVATRIQDTEASVGEKVFLFEVIGNAAQALSSKLIDENKAENGSTSSHAKT